MRQSIGSAAFFFLFFVSTVGFGNDEAVPVGGVYEMGIGATDPIPLLLYWQQFGYTLGREGELD